MSISLQKGQKVNLSKDNAGLSSVIVGLGWDEAPQKGGLFSPKPKPIDCDASAIMLKNGKLAAKGQCLNRSAALYSEVSGKNDCGEIRRKRHGGP